MRVGNAFVVGVILALLHQFAFRQVSMAGMDARRYRKLVRQEKAAETRIGFPFKSL